MWPASQRALHSYHRGHKLPDSRRGKTLGRKDGRDGPPPELPPSCCSCGLRPRQWHRRQIPVRCLSSRFTAVNSISPEPLGQLDGGHPLSTTFFDYPISATQLSLSFGLSAPVRASVSSEANSQDRRGNNSFPPSDPQPKMMLNESAFLLR